jgi:hypothetical protein
MLNQQQINNIFKIASIDDFNETALEIFRYQLETNSIYRDFVTKLRLQPEKVLSYHQIPFLPIDFFKNHQVICGIMSIKISLSTTSSSTICLINPALLGCENSKSTSSVSKFASISSRNFELNPISISSPL